MYFYSGLGLRPLSGLYLEELNKGKIMFEWNGFNYWAAEHYDFKVVQGTEEHCLALFRAEKICMHEFITHPRAAPAPTYEIIISLSYLFIYNTFPSFLT